MQLADSGADLPMRAIRLLSISNQLGCLAGLRESIGHQLGRTRVEEALKICQDVDTRACGDALSVAREVITEMERPYAAFRSRLSTIIDLAARAAAIFGHAADSCSTGDRKMRDFLVKLENDVQSLDHETHTEQLKAEEFGRTADTWRLVAHCTAWTGLGLFFYIPAVHLANLQARFQHEAQSVQEVRQALSSKVQPAIQLLAAALREAADFFDSLHKRLKEMETKGRAASQGNGSELHLAYMDMMNCTKHLRGALEAFERNMRIQHE